MAEWSKALVLGTSLCGGVGSNPTTAIFDINDRSFSQFFSHFKFAKLVRWEKMCKNGDAGVRTPDLLHAKQALYH